MQASRHGRLAPEAILPSLASQNFVINQCNPCNDSIAIALVAEQVRTSQSDVVKDGHIVADDSSGAYDHACAMIQQQALADDCAGVDVDAQPLRHTCLQTHD